MQNADRPERTATSRKSAVLDGFYWLGHDVLQDTMHFEFLGDPDKVIEPASSGAPSGAVASP
ncbi:hypothetical protein F1331_25700 [Salmonella enterica subsp. enterica serovar Dessau]|uniref:Peptidase M15C domain-containing protein n=1 Tax=Salmonella enterica subsp. enterica serovar Dessau TaxID=2564349 RepID=A0A8E5MYK0_SALET|nr:hypothetical protein [Salmonella enterica]QUS47068.1 hypothetical protein F1331_25700 [Salmonella enterica subsp. enterica serovar Dessau]